MQVDSTKEVGKDNKIPGISLLNNFAFEENGIRIWRVTILELGAFSRMLNLVSRNKKILA